MTVSVRQLPEPATESSHAEIVRLRAALAESEARAARWEARFATLSQDENYGIVIVSKSGIVLFANPTAHRLLRVPELVGKTFGHALAHDLTASFRVDNDTTLEMRVRETVWDNEPAFMVNLTDISVRIGLFRTLETTLRHNRHLITAIENMGVGVITTTGAENDFAITYANPAFLRMTGYTLPEVMGQNCRFLSMPDSDPDSYAQIRAALANAQKFQGVLLNKRKDGSFFWNELTINPVFAADGTLEGFVGIQIDVTERRRAEIYLQEEHRLLETFYNTGRALNSSLNLEDVLHRILENVGEVLPYDGANIALISSDSMYVAYARGRNANALNRIRLPLHTPNLRRMIENGDPVLVADTQADRGWVWVEEARWVRSCLGAPIKAFGQVIGFLNLDSAIPNFYTLTHREWLRAFADQAAIAIQNAQLYDEMAKKAEEVATLNRASALLSISLLDAHSLEQVAERVVTTVVKEFEDVSCSFLTFDPAKNQVHHVAQAGGYIVVTGVIPIDGPGLIAQAVREQRTVYVEDVSTDPNYIRGAPAVRSELVIPLLTGRGCLGVLDLESRRLNAFRPQDRRILEDFAARAAVLVENFHLWQTVIESNEQLELRVRERTADLNTARSRLNAILDGITEGVMYMDVPAPSASPVVTYTNSAMCRLLGATPQDLIGKTGIEIGAVYFDLRDATKMSRDIQKTILKDNQWEGQMPISHPNSIVSFVHVTITPVMNDNQVGLVVLMRDISQEKRLEAERERFIANASHELRTPLASATARLYLIRRQPEKIAEHLRVIESGINRMTALVEDMLDVSRFQRGIITLRREPVNLQNLIAAAVDEQRATAAEKGISLQVDLPATPLTAIVDPTRIIQMLSNLILNGIIYTPKGGHVSVRLRLTGHADNLQAQISVQDTGTSLAEDESEEIFKPFYRVEMGKAYGTGLGLTISREIVKLHGGEITVESTPNVGTTFTVLLPLTLPTPYKE